MKFLQSKMSQTENISTSPLTSVTTECEENNASNDITNNEATRRRWEEREELRDERGETIATNNEASERGNEAVEELQDKSREVVNYIYLYYRNQMTNKYKIEEK